MSCTQNIQLKYQISILGWIKKTQEQNPALTDYEHSLKGTCTKYMDYLNSHWQCQTTYSSSLVTIQK